MTVEQGNNDAIRKRRFRPQFRLASLFWMTLVVAAFFLGQSFDQLWESVSQYWSMPARVKLTEDLTITLRVGEGVVVRGRAALMRMSTSGRASTATVVSSTDLLIVGQRVGATQIDVWPKNAAKPSTIRVSVSQ